MNVKFISSVAATLLLSVPVLASADDCNYADKEALRKVLLYHVVSGKVTEADVAKLSSATTVQGSDVMIDTSDGVKINDATVVAADIMVGNGIIHVIDAVLMPK